MEPVGYSNQSDIGMVLQSADSTILACNPAAEQLLGYTAVQLMGTTSFDSLWQTINPDDEYPARTALRTGKPCLNVVLGFHKPNGELIWLCLSSHPLFQADATTPYAVMTTFSPISEEQQPNAGQQLAEIEAIYATAPVGLCFIDTNLRFVRLNEHLAEINGIPVSEHIGRTLREILPDRADDLEPLFRQVIESGQPILNLEISGTNPAQPGVQRDWVVSYYPLKGAFDRVLGVNAMVQEISDRKRTEAALRDSEAGYRQLVELCPDGIFIQSGGKFEFVNPAAVNLFGATEPEQLIGKTVMDFIHPDYREIAKMRMQQLQQNQTVPLLEEKFFRLDGTVVEVEVAAAPIVYQGKPAVQAVIRDITARKQTAAALSQSEERFRQLANAMPQMIWTTDALGELNYVSQQWIDYSGLTLEQMRDGSQATEFMHPDEIPSTQAQWRAALASLTTYQVEMRIIRASDDTYRWFLVRAVPIRDERGQVVQWYGTSTDIDDRKQVEAALRQMNERFRLATLAIDGIVFEWNMLSGEVYRSEGLYQLIGVRAEDAAPTREWWMERIHPDDLAGMEPGMQSLESLGDRYEGEYRVRHADGRWIDVWERGCLRRDESGQIVGILGFTTDITNRKQAEITLRQSEERYRYLAESIPQLVWTANAQGVLLDLNQRWLDFTGLTFPQAQTEGWQAIVHPDDLPILSENWAAAQKDGTRYQAEGRIRRADGVYRWHLHQAIAVKDEQNQIVKWFGTATDIEDQKQLEQQRDRLLQQEQVAREKAEQANRIKDEFLAVLSHELRTPLNPILGWTRLLQTGKVNATKTAEALTTIERNAKLQVQLIEDLLDVSRILRGKLTLNVTPVNLADAIAAALETVKLAAQAKDIQIQSDLDPNVGMVSGDAGRLQQIVWNLLSNAVKFTPQGGRVKVQLQIADCRLQIDNQNQTSNLQSDISNLKSNKSKISNLKSEISYAQIQVIDNGKGINRDFLPYVFEHFRQEDSAITRKFGGLGLGLAIVRQLVELHGGTVFAESQGEGTGATFTVRLPLIKQQAENETNFDQGSEYMIQSSPLAGLKIIVVDDDADSRDFIAFVLEQDGAEVIALPSAQQALHEFPDAKPDVLVSDIGMPEMDGYMLMRQIRALPPDQGGKVRAIALTAYAGEGDSKQALSAGFQQHIAKPIEPNQLVQAVAKLAGQP